jgi:MoaA/NifB/PqqE/SkfB family radical SAM enzyme
MKGYVEADSRSGVIEERLGIEVTTRCNIDCSHCFARSGISEPSNLSLALVKEIIAEGYNTGYRHLHITGGEPLLWENLFETLDYAFDIGYQTVFLNTNGTLLTQDACSRLGAYDGILLSVSLEVTEALHDHLRGKGSYPLAAQGIARALDAGIDLCLFATACKSLLPDFVSLAQGLNREFSEVQNLTLIQLMPVNNELFSLSEELLDPEDFLHLIDQVSLLNLMGVRTRFLNNPLAYVASKVLKLFWIFPSEPLYSEGSMIVMANRDICLSHSSGGSFGKYAGGMIEKVLDSDSYRKAVEPDQRTCPVCRYFRLCRENGMIRPSERCWDIEAGALYCKKVLDLAWLSTRRREVNLHHTERRVSW